MSHFTTPNAGGTSISVVQPLESDSPTQERSSATEPGRQPGVHRHLLPSAFPSELLALLTIARTWKKRLKRGRLKRAGLYLDSCCCKIPPGEGLSSTVRPGKKMEAGLELYPVS